MEKKYFSGAFLIFGISGVIAYTKNQVISSLLLGLVFIIIGVLLFASHKSRNRKSKGSKK